MIKVWRYWIVRPKALFLLSQFALLTAVFLLAAWERQMRASALPVHDQLGLVLLLLVPQFCSYLNGFERFVVDPDFRRFVARTVGSLMMGLFLTLPVFLLYPTYFPGYKGALTAVLFSALLLFGFRPLMHWLIRRRKFVEGLLIVGTGDLARKVYKELTSTAGNERHPLHEDRMLVLADRSDCPEPFEDSGELIGFNQLREVMVKDRISRIVVAEPAAHNSEDLAVALLDCKLHGLEVEQASESYEKLNSKIWLEALRPEWLVYSEGFSPSKYYLPLKRCFDLLAAVILLVLGALPMAIVSVLIKIDSEGPILFRQLRVGLHGSTFVLFKFRTMRPDAEQRTGPVWAAASDQRITPIGKYLRKFRLDELPQLLNVVWGDMSLIGPRPERPYFVELLTKHIHYYGLRHCVKPGITGWAQVLYPYGASIQDAYEKLQYDLYYAKHMSLRFDLRILASTLRVVLFGRGR